MQVVATYHGDHAYCFDVTGAAPPPQAAPGTTAAAASGSAAPALDLFAQPVAAAALAAGRHLRNGSSGAAGGPSSGYTAGGSSGGGGGGGGMGDLPGMLPAAAERAKADGNLHLFSKQVGAALPLLQGRVREHCRCAINGMCTFWDRRLNLHVAACACDFAPRACLARRCRCRSLLLLGSSTRRYSGTTKQYGWRPGLRCCTQTGGWVGGYCWGLAWVWELGQQATREHAQSAV